VVTRLELLSSIGPESGFVRDSEGHETVNPKFGSLGQLDEIGLSGLFIKPSGSAVKPEGSTESRIVPGTRIVETNSAGVAAQLLAEGMFALAAEEGGLFSDEALFPDETLFPE